MDHENIIKLMLIFLYGLNTVRSGICFGYGVRQAFKNNSVLPHPSDSSAKSSRFIKFSNLISRSIFQYSASKIQDSCCWTELASSLKATKYIKI